MHILVLLESGQYNTEIDDQRIGLSVKLQRQNGEKRSEASGRLHSYLIFFHVTKALRPSVPFT